MHLLQRVAGTGAQVRALAARVLAVASLFTLFTIPLFITSSGRAASDPRRAGEPNPQALERCYLEVAATKATADAIHAAQDLCDSLYKSQARSLVLAIDNRCQQWWFDDLGRRVTGAQLCVLDIPESGQLRLACERRDERAPVFVTTIDEASFETVADRPSLGKPPRIYPTLARCLLSRTKR
ncbi:MAG: hypothetical protein AAFP04_06335 [Myxococcota bacterium]